MDYRSPPYHSSHYAQAYRKQQCQSISHQESTQQITFQNLQLSQLQPFQQVAPPMNYRQMSAWYQAGGSHCTYRNCKFAGSKRVVETHMMDRHLIYPPGWDPKKSSTWDADPSLKGKLITIQGTMIVLDTPEDLDAWISERKRRWPSAARVEEKSKRLDEAVSRGQIVSGDPDFHRRKRPRMDEPRRILKQANPKGCGVQQHDIARVEPPRAYAHPLPAKPLTASNGLNSSDSDNDDIPPEVISSKPSHYPSERLTEAVNQNVRLSHSAQQKKRMNQQLNPPTPLSNPFGSQSPLLRILLLPEIRVTISNLSQTVRFLVENNFLDDVELDAGQAVGVKLVEEVKVN